MKYLYKHGNQFWYQRAVPSGISSFFGKKSIKISLKTNKLELASERAKKQGIKHDILFKKLQTKINEKLFFSKLKFKNTNIKNYDIKFSDDFDDLVSNFFFSKKNLLKYTQNVDKTKSLNKSLENYVFERKYKKIKTYKSNPRKKSPAKSPLLFLTVDELKNIRNDCKNKNDKISYILGLMINTGFKISEIIGLKQDDIYLNDYQNYIVIRSNPKRKIKSIFRKRVIPLTKTSLWAAINLKNKSTHEYIFNEFLSSSKKRKKFEYLVNERLRILSKKTTLSFIPSLLNRLMDVQCPENVIYDILGKTKKNCLYNNEISLELKLSWLDQVAL